MSNASCREHFVASRVFIDEPIEFEVFQVGARLPQIEVRVLPKALTAIAEA